MEPFRPDARSGLVLSVILVSLSSAGQGICVWSGLLDETAEAAYTALRNKVLTNSRSGTRRSAMMNLIRVGPEVEPAL
jgi:hypothetical protein